MGQSYFAVDYRQKKQMWTPKGFPTFDVYDPRNPLSQMICMENFYHSDFVIVGDGGTYEEHEYEDVTEQVFEKLKKEFPFWNWEKYEEF